MSAVPALVAARPGRLVALDGLRAVAVVLVVLFHAGELLPHGFLGVDVFFVLSGFLITTLISDEVDRTGRLRLPGFYRRRARRLLPALVAVCVAVVLLAVVTGRQAGAVTAGAVASLLSVANIWLYSGHDTPLLQHTWTLSLETQFYLVWPLLLGIVLRSRWFGFLLLGAAVLGSALALVVTPDPVGGTYVRAVGLPLGCALALLLRRQVTPRWWAPVRWVAPGCLLLLVVVAAQPTTDLVPDAVPSLLTLPVVAALTTAGPLTTVLAWRPLVWMGERSYGLYLWHFPVLSLALNQSTAAVPQAVRVVGGIAVSLVAAAVSYRVMERPFLRRSRELGIAVAAAGASNRRASVAS